MPPLPPRAWSSLVPGGARLRACRARGRGPNLGRSRRSGGGKGVHALASAPEGPRGGTISRGPARHSLPGSARGAQRPAPRDQGCRSALPWRPAPPRPALPPRPRPLARRERLTRVLHSRRDSSACLGWSFRAVFHDGSSCSEGAAAASSSVSDSSPTRRPAASPAPAAAGGPGAARTSQVAGQDRPAAGRWAAAGTRPARIRSASAEPATGVPAGVWALASARAWPAGTSPPRTGEGPRPNP